MEVDRNGLEVLDRQECLRLLAASTLGRVGFTSGALPSVLPVDFHLDGDRILVRAGRGTKLGAALRNVVVAFEVDEIDSTSHTGWSVAVTGVATAVTDAAGLDQAGNQTTARWTTVGDEALIAISTEVVSGRRITAASREARPRRAG
jgi:nitroimidazol reductase NimA-like FMN-containing flavoprotein (pyridoxamine 5'-phosphate oxidase superfamily)